jgi:hypothetical protein
MAVNLDEVLRRVREDLDQVQAAVHRVDPVAQVFEEEVRGLLGDTPPDVEAVRRGARLAVAEQAWEQRLGVMLDSKDVESALGVSRQRVSVLAQEHRLVALPKPGGGRRFPAWQFTRLDSTQRGALAHAHHMLVTDGGMSPWSAASWLLGEQPELGGSTPVHYAAGAGDLEHLALVASRDAARAVQ